MTRIQILILVVAMLATVNIAHAQHINGKKSTATSTQVVNTGLPSKADERRAELKNKTPTERKKEANKAAINSTNVLMNVEAALEHHAEALKKNIEAFTRRGIDADADRAKLEADLARLPSIKSSIIGISNDASSLDPANKEVFALYRDRIKNIREQLKAIRTDMRDIVTDLKNKSLLLESAANATTTPAPQR